MIFCTNDVPNDRKKDTCSGGNKTETIEKLLAAGAEAGATLIIKISAVSDFHFPVQIMMFLSETVSVVIFEKICGFLDF